MRFRYAKMIFIVDSNRYSAQMTSRLLQSWGFSTEVAHSTIAALKMLNNGEVFPDLIFVEMPSANNAMFKFPAEVHSNELWKSVPIVARGPSSDRANIVRAIESGYCDYIVRPMEADVLREKLEKVFDRSLNIDAATFSVPINVTATATLSVELTGISEFGVEGYCHQPLQPDSVVHVRSEFFKQFGFEDCNFRVIGCEQDRGVGKHKLAMTFVGLGPQSAKLIRKFSLGQSGKVSMTASILGA
jgi:two-component system chemotaxis response regulator CheY